MKIKILVAIAVIGTTVFVTNNNSSVQSFENAKPQCMYAWDDPIDGCYTSNDLACPEIQVKQGIHAECPKVELKSNTLDTVDEYVVEAGK